MLVTRTWALAVLAATLLGSGCIEDPLPERVQRSAVEYLVAAQNEDGGWSAVPGAPSDFSTTCWVVLGLASANAPKDVLERAKTRLEQWSGNASRNDTGSFSASNAVALYSLAGFALGVPQARWNGSDPLAQVAANAKNESLALNEKLFVLGTLGRAGRASEASDLRQEIRTKLDQGNGSELGTDAWFRSVGVLAMLASGDDPESESSRMWARSLLPYQKEESGFFSDPAFEPDASTTSSVLAVLTKIRFVYSSDRTAAIEFLHELQQPDGWVRFSFEHDFSRAKTTAEALLGLTGAGVFGA